MSIRRPFAAVFPSVLLALSVLALSVLGIAALARVGYAEEEPAAPAGPPPPRAKITSPYVESVLGSWDARIVLPGGQEMKGTARFWLALDGTALAEDFVAGEGDHTFHGFGVWYVSADGKTAKQWWFDSDGGGNVWASEGPLTADGWELHSEVGGAKSIHRMKKEGDGHVFTMEAGGAAQVTVHYTKAEKACPWTPVSEARRIKHPLIDAELGDWDVKGKFTMGDQTVEHTGTSTMRLIVGGLYVLQDYEIKSELEHTFAYGVSSVAADGKSLKTWWFANSKDKPTLVQGPLTDTEWQGKTVGNPQGDVDLTWTKTETGLRLRFKMPSVGAEGEETYTRRK